MKVLFVGDAPSKKNKDPNVPFEGTKSGVVLKQWAEYLDVKYDTVNSHDEENLAAAVRLYERFTLPIITLGEKARKRVKKVTADNGWVIYWYHLPHPSGLNRKLNDKEWLQSELDKCKKYLQGWK